MMPRLSGPSRPPASGGKPRCLVILLHGLGADGNDLIGLAPYWARLLPNAEFVSPNAPFPCDTVPYGYQWFSSQDRSPEAVLGGVRAAAPILDAFIDEALEERVLARHNDVAVCWPASCRVDCRHRRFLGTAARPGTAGHRAVLAPARAPG